MIDVDRKYDGVKGQRLLGRRAALHPETGQKSARTSFLPEIGPKSASDGRPPGRRGPKPPSNFVVLSEGFMTGMNRSKGTSSLVPSLPQLPSLVNRSARVDKRTSVRTKKNQEPENKLVLEPRSVVKPVGGPRRTGTGGVGDHLPSGHRSSSVRTREDEGLKMRLPTRLVPLVTEEPDSSADSCNFTPQVRQMIVKSSKRPKTKRT